MTEREPGTDDDDVLVVKLGGSTVKDLGEEWWDDLARLAARKSVILVHGWSKALADLDPAHGLPSAFARDRYGNRSRITDPRVLSDIHTVSEAITAGICGALAVRGLRSRRVVGSDGLLHTGPGERWWWRDRQLVEFDNLVGPLNRVDLTGLCWRTTESHVVVVTPLARDPDGRVVNVDADRAAAALAVASRAPALVLVTDVPKLLAGGSPVDRLDAAELAEFARHSAAGGMRKKVLAAGEALAGDTGQVHIGAGLVSDMLAGHAGTTISGRDVRSLLP